MWPEAPTNRIHIFRRSKAVPLVSGFVSDIPPPRLILPAAQPGRPSRCDHPLRRGPGGSGRGASHQSQGAPQARAGAQTSGSAGGGARSLQVREEPFIEIVMI